MKRREMRRTKQLQIIPFVASGHIIITTSSNMNIIINAAVVVVVVDVVKKWTNKQRKTEKERQNNWFDLNLYEDIYGILFEIKHRL